MPGGVLAGIEVMRVNQPRAPWQRDGRTPPVNNRRMSQIVPLRGSSLSFTPEAGVILRLSPSPPLLTRVYVRVDGEDIFISTCRYR